MGGVDADERPSVEPCSVLNGDAVRRALLARAQVAADTAIGHHEVNPRSNQPSLPSIHMITPIILHYEDEALNLHRDGEADELTTQACWSATPSVISQTPSTLPSWDTPPPLIAPLDVSPMMKSHWLNPRHTDRRCARPHAAALRCVTTLLH